MGQATNFKRLPLMFDLSDPRDEAIWEALEPYVQRRRGNSYIRDVLERALFPSPVEVESLASRSIPRAKRPNAPLSISLSSAPLADEADVDRAVESMLDMFG